MLENNVVMLRLVLLTLFVACSVLYYVRSYRHIEALWFANTANSILWFTYVKAFWRAINSAFGEKIRFKTTVKGEPPLLVLRVELVAAAEKLTDESVSLMQDCLAHRSSATSSLWHSMSSLGLWVEVNKADKSV